MAADYSTENGKVRYNIGDVTDPYLIDDVVIDTLLAAYPDDTAAVRIWRVTVQCLLILKARMVREGDRRREREGGVEIEVYQTKGYQNICDLLDYWERNPPDSLKDISYAGFFFGGVSKEERARVENDPDSIGAGVKVGGELEDSDEYIPESFTRYR